MIGPPITGIPNLSRIILIGQAPGDKEGNLGKPFAWTAGKTLFKWFASIGVTEDTFRQQAYIAAVCRCFPGKLDKGGDRVPNKKEIKECSNWLTQELKILQPNLIIPVGKLAINQFINCNKLIDVIGNQHSALLNNHPVDLIPLPHPSGASTWHQSPPGKVLLQNALEQLKKHPSWKNLQ